MTECYDEASEAVQYGLYHDVLARTDQALECAGIRTFHLRLAGTLVRLELAGPAMWDSMTTALRHLQVQDPRRPADAVFKIWDSVSTGIDNIDPPWNNTDYSDRGDIWGFNSKRYRSSFHWGDFGLNLFDTGTNVGIYWTRDGASLPYWSKAAPLRPLFHWWMQQRGYQLMHAAAVGNRDGAILITGRGGIGKSGTALSCLQSGMQFLGDDYLVVGLEPEPRVYSLYSTAKVHWDQLDQYPGVGDHLMPSASPDDEKASVALSPFFEEQLPDSLALRLLVTPRFHHHPESALAPVSTELLQGAATLTTVSQLPHSGQQVYGFVQELIRRVPAATLLLGQDRNAIPSTIADCIRPPVRNLAGASSVQVSQASAPLISVIIPVFNGTEFLMDAVENVRSQAYPSLEVIVVDDGSTDDLEPVVRQLPMEVRFLRQANRGPGAARNLGVKNASGDFLAFLDADDYYLPEKLAHQMRVLDDRSEIEMVFGHIRQFHSPELSEQERRRILCPKEPMPAELPSTLLCRRALFDRVGCFETHWKVGQDVSWVMRVRGQGLKSVMLPEVVYMRRLHRHNNGNTRSEDFGDRLKIIKAMLDRRRTAESRGKYL